MDYQKSWRLECLCIKVGGILAAAAFFFGVEPVLFAGFVIVIAGVVQSIFFCRCPDCRAFLDPRGGLPKYCPECGSRLTDPESEKTEK